MKPQNRKFLRYLPPGADDPLNIKVGDRQLDLINALRKAPATRLDLLRRGRPRIALNATALISQLRKKGIAIQGRWETAREIDGGRIRFMRYALAGRVLGTSHK